MRPDKLFSVWMVVCILASLAWCSFLGWLAYTLLEWILTK